MKRIESLFKTASMKFEFQNLEIRFHKCKVSFLVVKTAKLITSYAAFANYVKKISLSYRNLSFSNRMTQRKLLIVINNIEKLYY